MTKLQVLTSTQVEQFMEEGYTHLTEAFPRRQALAAQDFLWERLAERGVQRADRSTWLQPMVRINETYTDPVFQQCVTPRLIGAIEDLVGPGRYAEARENRTGWGWWPINFSLGGERPWVVPDSGWHWDGSHFRHFVDSPDQGLLLLCIFSDIPHHGGGTTVAAGSHKVVARFLAQFPEGIEHRAAIEQCSRAHPWLERLTSPSRETVEERNAYFLDTPYIDDHRTTLRVVETSGSAGDIILCHPFLYHASAQNLSGVPRFMCNRTTPLTGRMQTRRSDGDYSPLELSLRQALGVQE